MPAYVAVEERDVFTVSFQLLDRPARSEHLVALRRVRQLVKQFLADTARCSGDHDRLSLDIIDLFPEYLLSDVAYYAHCRSLLNSYSTGFFSLDSGPFVPLSYLHHRIVRAVAGVRYGAALLRISYAEHILYAKIFQLFSQLGLRSDSHGQHDTICRDLRLLTCSLILYNDSAILYAAELSACKDLCAVRPDPLHLVINKLEPCARGDLIGHLNDGYLVAMLIEVLCDLESGHTRSDDHDIAVVDGRVSEQKIRCSYDIFTVDARYRTWSERCTARSTDDRVRFHIHYLSC